MRLVLNGRLLGTNRLQMQCREAQGVAPLSRYYIEPATYWRSPVFRFCKWAGTGPEVDAKMLANSRREHGGFSGGAR